MKIQFMKLWILNLKIIKKLYYILIKDFLDN